MKLETFFEKFDLFADAPDAVAKMRELVLHLAVQGRLVDNSPDNLLSGEQIASDKERHLRDLRIRSHPDTPRPTEDDFPFALPPSWHAVSLGDLAYSCPTSYGEDPAPSLVKAGVVKVGNIDNKGGFKGRFSERGFVAEEFESLVARRGDLMVVKSSGSAENVHSGKAALCTAEHDGEIVGTNFVLRLRLLGSPAIPEYVWRVLTSRYSRAWIEGTVQTMTYPNLKWSDFARLPIPLPPLAEQKRIVAKVDELMALCDRLEAQQQVRETRHVALARASLARFADASTPANLQFLFHKSYAIPPAALRTTILTLAIQGDLRSQPDEVGFPQVRLDSLGAWAQGCGFPIAEQGHTDRPILFSKVSDMNLPGNEREILNTNHTIDEATAKRLRIKVHPPGTVIFPKIGGAIATNKRRVLVRPTAIDNNCSGIIPNKSCSTDWVFLVLSAIDFAEYQSGTSVPAVNQGALGEIEVSLPPLAEQRQIVAKVDELMALVDALETQLATARTTATALLGAAVSELTNSPERHSSQHQKAA